MGQSTTCHLYSDFVGWVYSAWSCLWSSIVKQTSMSHTRNLIKPEWCTVIFIMSASRLYLVQLINWLRSHTSVEYGLKALTNLGVPYNLLEAMRDLGSFSEVSLSECCLPGTGISVTRGQRGKGGLRWPRSGLPGGRGWEGTSGPSAETIAMPS